MSEPTTTATPTDDPEGRPVRYRCTSCGNLTRFEVTATRRTRSFHHYTVGGELAVERVEVLAEDVESAECTWCGPAGAVEPLPEA